MKEHPDKHIRAAIDYALARGWIFITGGKSAHCFGRFKTTPTRHCLLMNHYAGEAAMRWKNSLKSTQKVQLQNFANWPTHSLSTLFHFPFSKSC